MQTKATKVTTGAMLLLLPILLLLANSCTDSGCVVHHFEKAWNDGWRVTDTMSYDIPEVGHSGWYTLSIEMRTGEKFLYRTLYLAVERRMHNPERHCCDTVAYNMTRDSLHMDSRGSTLQTFSRPVMKVMMKKGQHGTIRIWHLMSREVLPDIHEVGLLLHSASRSVNPQKDEQQNGETPQR